MLPTLAAVALDRRRSCLLGRDNPCCTTLTGCSQRVHSAWSCQAAVSLLAACPIDDWCSSDRRGSWAYLGAIEPARNVCALLRHPLLHCARRALAMRAWWMGDAELLCRCLLLLPSTSGTGGVVMIAGLASVPPSRCRSCERSRDALPKSCSPRRAVHAQNHMRPRFVHVPMRACGYLCVPALACDLTVTVCIGVVRGTS